MKNGKLFASIMLIAIFGMLFTALNAGKQPTKGKNIGLSLPDDWQSGWDNPPPACRPIQRTFNPNYVIMAKQANPERMAYYRDRGLGGIIISVAWDNYLQSEKNWKVLIAGIEACKSLGLRVWLYDEKTFPSGKAGGLVLRKDPTLEAQVLTFDAAAPEPFGVRPAFELTRIGDALMREYINILDDRATRYFLQITHDAYFQRLGRHFGRTIEAVFTDEPNLPAFYNRESGVKNKLAPMVDPTHPPVKRLPCIPWCNDLVKEYQKVYGENLLTNRRSIFEGDSPEDRALRQRFWALVADLVTERYFGQIQQWCHSHNIASSGHDLREEFLMHHVPLYGNLLKTLGRMDIPGLDMLTSDPEVAIRDGWLTTALPVSAAVLKGNRLVMTELSDYSENRSGKTPVGVDTMQAAAAWQAAWGVTEYVLFYQIDKRTTEEYKAFCDFVGRLNAILREAEAVHNVLLYYPIYDLWAEYKPVTEVFSVESQSLRAQKIVASFMNLCRNLQCNQIRFLLADHELLSSGKVQPDGRLMIGKTKFQVVIIPEDVELPKDAAAVIEQFRKSGGRVVMDSPVARPTASSIKTGLTTTCRLTPASSHVAFGNFIRDGRRIMLLVNLRPETYSGTLDAGSAGSWMKLDPSTGDNTAVQMDGSSTIAIQLAPLQSILLIQQ